MNPDLGFTAHRADYVDMDVFIVTEPLYDICESWAEEPDSEAWDAAYADVRAWLVRAN